MAPSLTKFFHSFTCAFNGIRVAYRGRNMRIHGLVTLLVVVAGLWWRLSPLEWIIILILIGLVWSAELVNTSLEELADLIRDHQHLPYQATRDTRDIAAGAVLILAIISALVGFIIFWPHLSSTALFIP
ncbi:diacylglycerol kinase family protein [Patescibacteria group bacterium]|nr:diacylglycerol kinase family protein [Patescibacteria group bacterium]